MRVALVGCGRIVRLTHLQSLRALSGVQVVALAERDPRRLAEASAVVPGAATFADYADAIRHESVDAVLITLPPALHAQAAIAAFEAGHHVYLEKPIAVHPQEAMPVLEAWRASGRTGAIGFNYRFHPVIQRAAAVLASGELGELVAIRSAFTAAPREQPPWKRERRTGGGALLELASHHIDLVRFLTGANIAEAEARRRAVRTEDDTALLRLRLENDVPVDSFFSLVAPQQDRWEFVGTAATLHVDRYAGTAAVEPAAAGGRAARLVRALTAAPGAVLRAVKRPYEPSHRTALQRFADAARSGAAYAPDLADGFRSLAVIAAAESAGPAGTSMPPPVAPRTRQS